MTEQSASESGVFEVAGIEIQQGFVGGDMTQVTFNILESLIGARIIIHRGTTVLFDFNVNDTDGAMVEVLRGEWTMDVHPTVDLSDLADGQKNRIRRKHKLDPMDDLKIVCCGHPEVRKLVIGAENGELSISEDPTHLSMARLTDVDHEASITVDPPRPLEAVGAETDPERQLGDPPSRPTGAH